MHVLCIHISLYTSTYVHKMYLCTYITVVKRLQWLCDHPCS